MQIEFYLDLEDISGDTMATSFREVRTFFKDWHRTRAFRTWVSLYTPVTQASLSRPKCM